MPDDGLSTETTAELEYLRAQVAELGAEALRLGRQAQVARRELDLRRRAFSLLARLGRTLGPFTELEPALGAVVPMLEVELQVNRVVALRRVEDVHVPFAWAGYGGADATRLSAARIRLPDSLADGPGVAVTRDTPHQEWIAAVRLALDAPFFAAVGVGEAGHALVVSRPDERAGFFPRFGDADVDTLRAVGDVVATAVGNTRIGALRELQRFLPPSVVQELMSGRLPADQGHTRLEVTLLAADLVGFTPLAERVEPEVLAGLLNAYLRDMMALAHAHGGTVGSLAGDGLIVIFGAPEPSPAEEHARAAAEAAFAMRSRMPVLAEEARRSGVEFRPRIRIGVNTGRCAVGVFGSDVHRTYTAMGMPVNIAARLESAAAPGEVLAGPRTLELLGGGVRAAERGRLSLKGVAEPVPAHAVDPL